MIGFWHIVWALIGVGAYLYYFVPLMEGIFRGEDVKIIVYLMIAFVVAFIMCVFLGPLSIPVLFIAKRGSF